MAIIESIQVGAVVTEGDPDSRDTTKREWTSAFRKTAVAGIVAVGRLGIAGDQVADKVHHGGPDKAVLCYPARHYLAWNAEYPELNFGPGGFGENFTIAQLTEDDVCIGDRWVSEHCEFEVSQPRQPCWKISRRWETKTLTKAVTQTGRTGWYLRVISGGALSAGESLSLHSRPHPSWSVRRANDILYRRETDSDARIELMSLAALSGQWKESLR